MEGQEAKASPIDTAFHLDNSLTSNYNLAYRGYLVTFKIGF